jgi:hypothetical protein
MIGSRAKDLTGQRFGRLIALQLDSVRASFAFWACRCDCGAFCVIRGRNLRNGCAKSCGCYARQRIGDRARRHGHCGTVKSPTYVSWSAMLCRVRGTSKAERNRYFERGITVAARWLLFDNFLADMGERPPGTSIDRVNNDGNYEPGNCRWATRKEQVANRSVPPGRAKGSKNNKRGKA